MRALCLGLLLSGAACGATYQVGPGRPHTHLNALFAAVNLEPGDLVLVDYSDTPYAGDIILRADDQGAPGNPVTLRGVKNAGGQRPHLRGGTNTIEFRLANHIVFESFEISGTGNSSSGTFRCVYHHSHDVVMRDLYIHDCPRHGVLGADTDSGSLTIEYSEITNAGSNGSNHAIYMATDEVAFPGAVFRLQYSHVHDSDFPGNSPGNLIKSRAERNEIYYNWLEDGGIHELELIGPDPNGAAAGWTPGLAREDSDVVGNVIVHRSNFQVIRIGGDGTGESRGRYRFVNNTIIARGGLDSPAAFRTHFGIEAVEMHNNVIWREGPTAMRIIREESPTQWVHGVARIHGSHNWIEAGASFVPAGWSQTIVGSAPGFANLAANDLRPALGSPLIDAGISPPQTPADYQIPSPLFPPRRHPSRALLAPATAPWRLERGPIEIGAYGHDPDLIFVHGLEY